MADSIPEAAFLLARIERDREASTRPLLSGPGGKLIGLIKLDAGVLDLADDDPRADRIVLNDGVAILPHAKTLFAQVLEVGNLQRRSSRGAELTPRSRLLCWVVDHARACTTSRMTRAASR